MGSQNWSTSTAVLSKTLSGTGLGKFLNSTGFHSLLRPEKWDDSTSGVSGKAISLPA